MPWRAAVPLYSVLRRSRFWQLSLRTLSRMRRHTLVAADLYSRLAGGLLIVRPSTILLVVTIKENKNLAKRKHNKSVLIREYMAKKPDATANEIVDALAAKKVQVSAAYIYALKGKNGKPKAGKAKSAALSGVDALVKAKKMADQLGGVDQARELLATLAQLV